MESSQDKECEFCPDNYAESVWFGKNVCWRCAQRVYQVMSVFAEGEADIKVL